MAPSPADPAPGADPASGADPAAGVDQRASGADSGFGADRGSAGWRWFFRIAYRLVRLADPAIRALMRRLPRFLPRAVDLRVGGRRSGRSRRTLVTLLTVGEAWYVGHPNGAAAWTRNLENADGGEMTLRDGRVVPVRAVRLWAGPELEAVVRATWSQQPFPANVAYALARGHVRRVGVYYRILQAPDQPARDQPAPDQPAPGQPAPDPRSNR